MELTYDKLTEIEKQIMSLAWKSIAGTGLLEQTFIEGLREIMPFTCTVTERMFLDEIREKGKYRENIGCVYIPGTASELYERDFKIVLKELVNADQL